MLCCVCVCVARGHMVRLYILIHQKKAKRRKKILIFENLLLFNFTRTFVQMEISITFVVMDGGAVCERGKPKKKRKRINLLDSPIHEDCTSLIGISESCFLSCGITTALNPKTSPVLIVPNGIEMENEIV